VEAEVTPYPDLIFKPVQIRDIAGQMAVDLLEAVDREALNSPMSFKSLLQNYTSSLSTVLTVQNRVAGRLTVSFSVSSPWWNNYNRMLLLKKGGYTNDTND